MNIKYASLQLVKQLSVVAATAALSLGIGNSASAATFTNPANGNQYFLTDITTWTDAQAQAVAAGGNLVTINDASEQAWLVNTFGGLERLWIGLTDTAQEGVFNWISGQAVTYTNWVTGEPNSGGGAYEEDYVVMNWSGAGTWNDLPNAGPGFLPTRGIVEIESVPEPATLGGILLIGAAGVMLKKKKAQSV